MSFRTKGLKPARREPEDGEPEGRRSGNREPQSREPRNREPQNREIPRWALIAGWGALVLPLPSVAWRIALLAGLDVGFGLADEVRFSAGGVVYVLGLEVLTLLVAVAGFGLIRPWGEVVPRWVPRLGGRTIPPLVPLIVGGIGTVVLLGLIGSVLVKFVLAWTGVVPGWTPDVGMSAGERAVLLACYIPFFVWPVAIAVALIGYGRRRLGARSARVSADRTPGSAVTV